MIFTIIGLDIMRRKIMKLCTSAGRKVSPDNSVVVYNNEAHNKNLIGPAMELLNCFTFILANIPGTLYFLYTADPGSFPFSFAVADILFYAKTLVLELMISIILPFTIYAKNPDFRQFLSDLKKHLLIVIRNES